jgi:hypothetical protein
MATSEHTTTIPVPAGLTFADRETHINREIQKHRLYIESKGRVYLDHRVNNRSDSKISVTFFFS